MKKSMKALGVVMLGFAAIAARAQAPGETTAWRVPDCDHACLTQFAKDYVAAVAKRNASTLKQAKSVHFTENNVELSFGKEGLWLTATGVAPTGLIAADTQAGTVAWLGTAEENGKRCTSRCAWACATRCWWKPSRSWCATPACRCRSPT